MTEGRGDKALAESVAGSRLLMEQAQKQMLKVGKPAHIVRYVLLIVRRVWFVKLRRRAGLSVRSYFWVSRGGWKRASMATW